MSKKAIVLCSGGLDSTTCLGMAVKEFGKENVLSLSVQYGQKHAVELKYANESAAFYGVEHMMFDLSSIYQYASDCSLLVGSDKAVPEGSYAEQQKQSGDEKVNTYVPFRNGLMLSSVAALAQSLYPDDETIIYIGAHADDSAGNAYADCSVEFLEAINEAISIGTYNKVSIVAPFAHDTKADIVRYGLSIDVPYNLTYSCYNGGKVPCGKCGTCIDRAKAFEANGIIENIEEGK